MDANTYQKGNPCGKNDKPCTRRGCKLPAVERKVTVANTGQKIIAWVCNLHLYEKGK